ncbi:MAG: EamA family transporter [Clostridiales bacterium]|nr:EamA family transporter [Clostridiales bacterium]
MKEMALFILLMLIWTVAQVFLKAGMNDLAGRRVDFKFFAQALTSWPVLAGLIFSAAGFIFWLVILSRFNLSYSYLLAGLTFALVLVASAIFFKEEISPLRWAGAALIILGVFLVSQTR